MSDQADCSPLGWTPWRCPRSRTSQGAHGWQGLKQSLGTIRPGRDGRAGETGRRDKRRGRGERRRETQENPRGLLRHAAPRIATARRSLVARIDHIVRPHRRASHVRTWCTWRRMYTGSREPTTGAEWPPAALPAWDVRTISHTQSVVMGKYGRERLAG